MPIFATNAGSFSPLSIKGIHPAGSAVDGFLIQNSLRFDSASSSYLSRTPSSAGNRKTFTVSFWIKRNKPVANFSPTTESVFGAEGGSSWFDISFYTIDELQVVTNAGAGDIGCRTQAVFRDFSAWYHFVIAVDTTDSTDNDRIKIYVNGVRQAVTIPTGMPALNSDTFVNSTAAHYFGRDARTSNVRYGSHYLADVHFIDGQALAATDFGEFDATTGVWQPIEYAGTYSSGSNYVGQTTYNNVDAGSVDNLFDGSTSTTFEANSAGGNIVFTPTGGIAYTTSVEVYTARSTAQGVSLNGGTQVSTSSGWNTIDSGSGTLNTLTFYNGDAGNQSFAAIRVDGTILVQGSGFNSFYLPFSDNSSDAALGKDASKSNLVNDGTVWSNYGTNINVDPTPRYWIHAFDGSTSTYLTGDGTTNSQALFDYSGQGGITVSSSLRLLLGGGTNSFVYVNGSQETGVTGVSVSSPQWYTVTGVSTLNSIGVGNNGSTWSTLHAVEVDGVILRDGIYDYGWTVNNIIADFSPSSWDYSQDWSTYLSFTTDGGGFLSGRSPGEVCFDGTRVENAATATSGTTAYIEVSGLSLTASDTLEITLLTSSPGSLTWQVTGTNLTTTNISTDAEQFVEIPITGSATTFRVSSTSTGRAHLTAIRINGKELILPSYLSGIDFLVDSPTNGNQEDTGLGGELVGNYATLNPLASGNSTTLSNGNLTMTSGANWQSCLSTFSFVGGKWYYEVTTVSNQYSYVGISRTNHNYQVDYPSKNKSWAMVNDGTCYYDQIGSDAITVSTGTSVGANGTVGVAIDADNGKIWWAINGTWLNSGNPATGANPIFTNVPSDEELVACMDVYDNTGTANFGATAFNYQAPSGFKCLCTANSTTSTVVDGSAAMDTVVYDSVGTGGGLSVSSLQFQPDLLIFKDMDGGNNWVWFDSLRRFGYKLDSSSQNGQADFTSYFTSIDSNGFTIPAGNHDINRDTNTIAAYCWNAGELAVSSDTTNYDQSQEWSANITPGFGGERIYDGSTITYADSSTTSGATLFSGTMTIPAGQDLQIRTQNGGASSITVDGNAVSTASGQVTTTLVSGPATVNTITAPAGFNIYYFTIGGKQLIDPGVIPIGGLNSTAYDQSQNFSGNTSNPTGSYGNASNAFDGNLSTHASPSYGNEMTYTNPSPSSYVIDTFEIYIDIYDTGVTVELNGTSIVSQLTTTQKWYTISGFEGQNFSTLKWGPTPGNLEARLNAVKVNGKILIDQGVTVPTNVPSLPAKVKRSPEYGFSMVKYFGDGNADVTVPHNLGKKPTFYIEKNTSATGNWGVLTNVIDGSMDFLYLNSNNSAKGDASQAQFTEQTFNVQTSAAQNILNNEYIQYIWTDIPGYSKAGVYTGSGGQQFVHLGFRPSWLLIKRYSDTTVGEWGVYNSTRSPNNEVQRKVWFNNNSGEEDHPNNSLAFTANGFIVDPGSDAPNVQYTNNGSVGYLYLAFAGNPFSNSTAF